MRRAYDASVFETTIRVLGGMLTAFELSNDRIFLTRCATVLTRRFQIRQNTPVVEYVD